MRYIILDFDKSDEVYNIVYNDDVIPIHLRIGEDGGGGSQYKISTENGAEYITILRGNKRIWSGHIPSSEDESISVKVGKWDVHRGNIKLPNTIKNKTTECVSLWWILLLLVIILLLLIM